MPPDAVEPLFKQIVNQFVHDRSRPEVCMTLIQHTKYIYFLLASIVTYACLTSLLLGYCCWLECCERDLHENAFGRYLKLFGRLKFVLLSVMLLTRHPLSALHSLNSGSFVSCVSYVTYSSCPHTSKKQMKP